MTALLVDPCPVLGGQLARALRGRHARVLHVRDVGAAIAALAGEHDIDLVVVAVDGPARGLTTTMTARAGWVLPFVVATHRTLEADAAAALRCSGVSVLMKKPFTTDELLRAVDDAQRRAPPEARWVSSWMASAALRGVREELDPATRAC